MRLAHKKRPTEDVDAGTKAFMTMYMAMNRDSQREILAFEKSREERDAKRALEAEERQVARALEAEERQRNFFLMLKSMNENNK